MTMHVRIAAWCLATCLAWPAVCGAQTATSEAAADAVPVRSGAEAATHEEADGSSFWAPFTAVPDDFVRFLSPGTLRVAGIGAAGALAAHQWDRQGIEEAKEHFRPSMFTAGNIGGSFFVQTGASLGLYSIGKLTGTDTLSGLGGDLVRAQALTQGVVQAAKFATRRARPDGSDRYSLPSGHTATTFATATVLQEHFGWKVGIPAYGFGAYVAASRMSANKHHLSDVLLGATIGIAAGRTVAVGTRNVRFAMGVAPTAGGAAITFTRQ
jgi:membrane-associated phospholipid phosphatase